MLKKIAMGTALAALIAAPAFAQAYNPGWGGGNASPTYYDAQGQLHAGTVAQRGTNESAMLSRHAYAYAPPAFGPSDRVYVDGHYAGQDPDPNVRLQLRQVSPAAY